MVTSILLVIGNLDPQGGLAIYSDPFSQFVGQIRTMFLLASAQALAVGFVASHQLMTQGTKPEGKGWAFLGVHALYLTCSLILFLVQMFTRNIPTGITSRSVMMLYSILVSGHTIISALQVRKILVVEHARTGKYAEGIYKLTRLVVLVFILVIIGNSTMAVTMRKTVDLVQTTHTFPEETDIKFSAFNIFSDFASVVSLAALITGSWKVSVAPNTKNGSGDRRTTRGSTTTSGRKSTPKLTSRDASEPASDTEAGPPMEVNSNNPIQLAELPPSPIAASREKLGHDEDGSAERRKKLGDYQELDV